MLRFLRKYVFANAALKILALGISFLLWTTYTSEPFAEIGFPVALEFTSVPPQMEISGDVPTQVRVRVRGRSAILRRLTPADLSLRIDVQNSKEGTALIHVTTDMVGAPFGVTVVQVAPGSFPVTLVPRRTPSAPAS